MCVGVLWFQTTVVAEDAAGVLISVEVVAGDRLVLEFERDAYIQVRGKERMVSRSGFRRNKRRFCIHM